jgi:hypothetical protein
MRKPPLEMCEEFTSGLQGFDDSLFDGTPKPVYRSQIRPNQMKNLGGKGGEDDR